MTAPNTPWIEELLNSSGLNELAHEAPLAEVEGALRKLTELTPGLDGLQLELLKQVVMWRLRALRIPAPGKLVAAAIGSGGNRTSAMAPGAMGAENSAPWPVPIDGQILMEDLTRFIRRFLVLPSGADAAIALWVIHAHAHDAAEHSPLLSFQSPVMRCGKTTALNVVGALVPRALSTSNITPAALFRSIQEGKPTLVIDEGDTFLKSDKQYLSVLNSGHHRTQAVVIRANPNGSGTIRYSTWGPKIFALIGVLPPTLQDRSVVMRMERCSPEDRFERFQPVQHGAEAEALQQKIARWAADNLAALQVSDPGLPEELGSREKDCWRPLVAIADLIGGEWAERARAAASILSDAATWNEVEDSILLLADLQDIFAGSTKEGISSAEVIDALNELDHRPWPEWKGKPITPLGVSKLLRRFGVGPQKYREGSRVFRGYLRSDLEPVFRRYQPKQLAQGALEPPEHPPQPVQQADAEPPPTPQQEPEEDSMDMDEEGLPLPPTVEDGDGDGDLHISMFDENPEELEVPDEDD
jgi:putative DNA primase/helicase